jgi:hypothetical protein
MWIRHLIEHISKTYHLLTHLPKTDIKIAYEKFVSFANNTQKRLYQEWWIISNDLQPKKLLQKAFLKENLTKKYLIDVYFDPQIIIALNESLWWIRLNYEIPYSLTDVYKTKQIFRQMREETNGFIGKFNK